MSLEIKKNLQFSTVFTSLQGELSVINSKIASLNKSQDTRRHILKSLHQRKETPSHIRFPSIIPEYYDSNRKKKSILFKSIDPSSRKEKEFLEKYFNLHVNDNSKSSLLTNGKELKKSKLTMSKPKFFKINPKILPRATRLDPISNPIQVTEEDIQKGIYSLVNLGLVPKNSDLYPALNENNSMLMHQQALLHDFSIQFENSISTKNIKSKNSSIFYSQETFIPTQSNVLLSEPTINVEKPQFFVRFIDGVALQDKNSEKIFESFNSQGIVKNIKKIENFCKAYQIKYARAKVEEIENLSGEDFEKILNVFENKEEIQDCLKRYEREKIDFIRKSSAALKIQCNWRRYIGAAQMRMHRFRKGKANFIQYHYIKYKKKVSTKNYARDLRENRQKQLIERQNQLKSDWKNMQEKEFIEIHMGSDRSQFPSPDNSEIFRIFLALLRPIQIIYISITDIEIEIENYLKILMKYLQPNVNHQIKFLTPTTLCKNPMKSAAKSLYLSSRDLVDLKQEIKALPKVLVPFVPTEFDEYVGDFLKSPIFGTGSGLFADFTHENRRKILENIGVGLVPGFVGVFLFEEFIQKMRELTQKYQDSHWEIYVGGNKVSKVSEWNGDKTALVIQKQTKLIEASFCIDPTGKINFHCAVKLIGNPPIGAIFPQRTISDEKVIFYCNSVGNFLYNLNIIGYVSILLSKKGIIDFKIGFNSIYATNLFFHHLMKGMYKENNYYVLSQSISDLEQEVYLDEFSNFITYENFQRKEMRKNEDYYDIDFEERQYLWIWGLFHEDLCGQKLSAILHMCRLESILFSLARNEGTIFLPYGSLTNGTIGIMSIAEDYQQLKHHMAKGIFIVSEMIENENKKGNLIEIANILDISDEIGNIGSYSRTKNYLVELV